MAELDHQDSTIFWISYETGLRIGDILKLRFADIRDNPLNIYETKSKRVRQIEISEELHRHLNQKFKYRFYFPFGNSLSLCFQSLRKPQKAINRSTYYRRLKKASKALKINFSAHSGRKLYAQNIFEQTGSVPAVQNALNHKYITTTATYLDIDLVKMLSEYKPN
jgi:integrase